MRPTLTEKAATLAAALARGRNAAERLAWLVGLARSRPAPVAAIRADANLVPGCLSRLWLVCELAEGHGRFECDSDSLVVRAVAGALCELASGCVPEEILAAEADLPARLGLDRLLTPNRRAAESRVWQRLQDFAASQVADAHPARVGALGGPAST